MPQRQAYPYSQRQTLSPAAAYHNLALYASLASLSALINLEARGNPANKNASHESNTAYQPAPRQSY